MLNQITVRSTFNWVESRYRLTEITVIIRVFLSPITVVSWVCVLWKAYFRCRLPSFSAGIPFPDAAHCSFHQVLRPFSRWTSTAGKTASVMINKWNLPWAVCKTSVERKWLSAARSAEGIVIYRKQDFKKYSRLSAVWGMSKSAKTEILIHVTVSILLTRIYRNEDAWFAWGQHRCWK